MEPGSEPDWRAVDQEPDPDRLLGFLDEVMALPDVAAAKRRSFELLNASPGDRLLDAGCGTGADAIALADAVQPGGEVTGVDSSEAAIAAARELAAEHPGVRFERADVTALPFVDCSFAAARADRVLLHLDRPVGAVHELIRVVRPGGRVVFSEGRLTGVTWLEGRAPRLPAHGDVLPALPLILEQLGAGDVVVERYDCDVELSDEAAAVIGIRGGAVGLSLVHIAGTVAGDSART